MRVIPFLFLVQCATYLLYYFLKVVKRPRLISGNNRFQGFLKEPCTPFLRDHFWPPIWCIGSNLQSLVSLLLQDNLPLQPYKRHVIRLSDGGLVALDWLNENCQPPVVIILPGLSSNSQGYYIRSLMPLLLGLTCPCAVFNNRGHGGLPINNVKLVSACATKDLSEVLAVVTRRYPGAPVIAVGYSLGGLLISHYLSENGDAAEIAAAMSISAPFHVPTSHYNLTRWNTNSLVNRCLAYWMLRTVSEHREVLRSSGAVDVDHLMESRTLEDFDRRYTAPVFGYRSIEEYYQAASLVGKLSTIRRPLLFLLSEDDIFGTEEVIPSAEIERSPWLACIVTSRGGHLGFVDGFLWPKPPFFSERLVASYLEALVQLYREPGGAKLLASLGGDCLKNELD